MKKPILKFRSFCPAAAGSLLTAALFLASGLPSQAKHLVLHEKYTNTGCGPCARYAPASDSLINVRLGEVVPITYHGNYPDSRDAFYLANKEHIDARIAQYEITGYPSVVLNGKQVNYSVNFVSDKIDELLQDEQTMDLNLVSKFENGVLDVTLTATPLKVQNNPNLRLFVCAVEEVVKLAKPAKNGQTEFHNEVRHFLSEPGGYNAGAFADLTPATFHEAWTVEGFDNTDELAVVAWVQDVTTGNVVEAVYAPKSTDKPNAAKVLVVKDTPDEICAPYYHGTVTFRNLGYENLTSCNICLEINGKVQKTPWQGNLAYLEKETVVTPDFTEFDLSSGDGTFISSFYLSDINGTDERSEAYRVNYKKAVSGKNAIEVAVFTDNKPEETAWELYDMQGNLLERSEPFTEKRKFHKHIFNLAADGCYRLRFTDTGGDGIIGDFGNGYYKLTQKTTDGKTKMIRQNEFSGAEHTVFFSLEDAVVSSVDEVQTESVLSIDAASRTIRVNAAGASLSLTDMAGVRLAYQEGNNPTLNCADLPKGIYLVTVSVNGEAFTKQIAF